MNIGEIIHREKRKSFTLGFVLGGLLTGGFMVLIKIILTL